MSLTLSVSQLGLSLVAGGLTTLSPCVLPMVPLVVGGALQGHRWAPVAMGLGMTASFALIGVVVGALGPLLGVEGDSVRTFGALLLIAFGVVMWFPSLNQRVARWMLPIASAADAAAGRVDSRSTAGAFVLGGALGLVWSPCSGPLLGSALALVASEGGAARGAIVLGVFGLGAAVPLVSLAYASRRGFVRARDWLLQRVERVRATFALLLGATGLAVLTGVDKRIEAKVLQWLPDAWINLTVGI